MRIKTHKYRAKPVVIDGIRFASTKEGQRYQELRLLEQAGVIRALSLQPRFVLYVRNPDRPGIEPIGAYRGDFAYEQQYFVTVNGHRSENWRPVVEDVKGFKTPLYRWKKKHVECQYGIEIREV